MNRKFYSSLTVIAVAFALVLGFGAFNVVKAVPGISGERPELPAGDVNLFGADEAGNSTRVIARDSDSRAFRFAPDTYGLHGTLRP